MREIWCRFLALTLLVLAVCSGINALDLDADLEEDDMCLNGHNTEKCCYDTYCPKNGDGSFLPTNMTGKECLKMIFTQLTHFINGWIQSIFPSIAVIDMIC